MEHIMTKTGALHTDAQTISLRYELTAQNCGGTVQYGVSVTNEGTGEQAALADLTGDLQRAQAFFARISSGLVTPVTLRETAEDFVAEM